MSKQKDEDNEVIPSNDDLIESGLYEYHNNIIYCTPGTVSGIVILSNNDLIRCGLYAHSPTPSPVPTVTESNSMWKSISGSIADSIVTYGAYILQQMHGEDTSWYDKDFV